jgi:hypothetical protein
MRSLRWGKQLDIRAFLVFQRIQRFYSTFVVLAALISGLAVAALTFSEFHPTSSELIKTSEGFLCSSAITAVISAVVATMLLFQFEGLEKPPEEIWQLPGRPWCFWTFRSWNFS